jgi:carbamoyltransferase
MQVYKNINHSQIAELIDNRHIVALFQGISEAGPRALGNRSLLFNPISNISTKYVNEVKGREWFRPVAGSILLEHFESWFYTYGIEDSPFMSYAFEVKEDKKELAPSIVHIDGTCRIQTVTEEQNYHYYNLIKEFYKITGVPIVGNTSFNLAGDPLVETLKDALNTLENSKIEYLYLPEQKKLVYARNV